MHTLMPWVLANAWLIPALPGFAFVLIGCFSLKHRKLSAAISLSANFIVLLGAAVLAAMSYTNPGQFPVQQSLTWMQLSGASFSLGTLVDGLSAVMMLMVTLVAFLIQLYSLGYLEHETDPAFSRFFAYISCFIAAMLGLVISPNLLQTYMCWELVGLCSYLLIGFWYYKPAAAAAAKKAFIVTRFGDLGFLIGIILVFNLNHSLNILELNAGFTALPGALATLSALLILCGAIGKSAQFPLHIWLPDAMEGPSPVSALIHAATMVTAGVYLIARLFPLFAAVPPVLTAIAYVGGVTALLAATMALVQDDLKKVLAYSTMSQLGCMFMALGAGNNTAAFFHLLTHAGFKALLFLSAGSVIHSLHLNDMKAMGNVGKNMPVTGWAFLIGALALSGIPPLSGFWSKDEIFSAVLNLNADPALKLIIILVVFLTPWYIFRAYYLTFCRSSKTQEEKGRENSWIMILPLIMLSLLAISAGWLQTPWGAFLSRWLSGAANPPADSHFNLHQALAGTLLAFSGLVAGVLYARSSAESWFALKLSWLYALFRNKYGMDRFWSGAVRYVLFPIAAFAAWFDDRIIDGAVKLCAKVIYDLGTNLRTEENGNLQYYALIMVSALILLAMTFGSYNLMHWLTASGGG